VGAERHLQIAPRGSLGPKARMTQRTKRLWDLAQEAGGAAAQLSLAEIQTMLDTKTLSPLLRQLEEQRCMQEYMCPVILPAMWVHWHLSPSCWHIPCEAHMQAFADVMLHHVNL